MATAETALGGWVPLVNLNKGSTIPLRFVLQLAHKGAPSHIRDGFRETVILHHILDRQTLNADHLVLTNHTCRELVLKITATVSDTSMNPGYSETRFLFITGTFFLLCMPTLRSRKSLLICVEEARIANGFTRGEHDERFEAQVHAYRVGRALHRCDLFFQKDRDEIVVEAILGDGDASRLHILWQRTRPTNIQWLLVHHGQGERRPFQGERVRHRGCRLLLMFLMKLGVLGTTFKEVHKRGVQVAQLLLQGYTRHLMQPVILGLLLELCQAFTTLGEGEPFVSLGVRISAFSQRPVVNHTTAAEGTSKDILLCIGRVEPIAISAFVFHTLHDNTTCFNCLYVFQRILLCTFAPFLPRLKTGAFWRIPVKVSLVINTLAL